LKAKYIFIIWILSSIIYGDKVEINSASMEAKNLKKQVTFFTDVHITQIDSWLDADKVIVFFDENNETKKYDATGNVSFEFKDLKKKTDYTGTANMVSYFPIKDLYILKGKAIVHDKTNNRTIKGNLINLDMTTGNANVKGKENKPVKFIFDMAKKDKK